MKTLAEFWEGIKAQGVHTALTWDRSKHKDAIREIDPRLADNLDALLAHYNVPVEEQR